MYNLEYCNSYEQKCHVLCVSVSLWVFHPGWALIGRRSACGFAEQTTISDTVILFSDYSSIQHEFGSCGRELLGTAMVP